MMKRLFLLAGLCLPAPALAQSNAACDAACPTPCYFGSCSPAKASYDRALESCDVENLDAVARLYRGTRSAEKAATAAATLRARGYGMSRIGVSPNASGQSCVALVGEDGGPVPTTPVIATPTPAPTPAFDPCRDFRGTPPLNARCVVENGQAIWISRGPSQADLAAQQAETARLQAERERLEAERQALQREREQAETLRAQQQEEAALRAPGALGPRPASGIAATEYDRCVGGDASQCFNLGNSYENGTHGVTQDYRRAVAAFLRACDAENASGCTDLGFMYLKGQGISRNYNRATTLYLKGCNGGNADGCSDLGYMYQNGVGLEQDYIRAVALYRQGCDGESMLGCNNLGIMYENGWGVARNYVRAASLYRQGCSGGSPNGCSNLGEFYRVGRGVSKDLAQARTFLTQGCNGGNDWGCDKLKLLP